MTKTWISDDLQFDQKPGPHTRDEYSFFPLHLDPSNWRQTMPEEHSVARDIAEIELKNVQQNLFFGHLMFLHSHLIVYPHPMTNLLKISFLIQLDLGSNLQGAYY